MNNILRKDKKNSSKILNPSLKDVNKVIVFSVCAHSPACWELVSKQYAKNFFAVIPYPLGA